MANEDNTNWGKSVAAIVLRDNKVLLARHTYGSGQGKLIIPGGYIQYDETPQEAVRREVLEETGITVEPVDIVGIRFNMKDWYVVFTAKYLEGIARSDGDENSEVVWMDLEEAITREDVPDLTKKLLTGVLHDPSHAFHQVPYESKNGPASLYGLQ